MRSRLRCTGLFTVVCLAVASLGATPEPELLGIWAWNAKWEVAHKELELGYAMATAPALIANFCPNGEFRMATGIFYRTDDSIELGSSDGIETYRGTWIRTQDEFVVRYRLASAELIDSETFDREQRTEIVVEPAFIGDVLAFAHRPRGVANPIAWVVALRSARDYEQHVRGRFVECADRTKAGGGLTKERSPEK